MNTKHIRVQKRGNKGEKSALSGYRKACRGQEIVAPRSRWQPTFAKGGATISCPSLLQRIKMVLFINHLLNHISYPTLARTPYQAWQAEEKTAAFPCTRCRCLGKRKRLFLFRRRLPWIIKNVHYRKRILTPWFIAGMGITGYGDLCLWRKFQRDPSCVPMKGCHVVMGAFFSLNMRRKIS